MSGSRKGITIDGSSKVPFEGFESVLLEGAMRNKPYSGQGLEFRVAGSNPIAHPNFFSKFGRFQITLQVRELEG